MTTHAPFCYHRTARQQSTVIIIAAVWGALWALWHWLDAALWLMMFLGVFTLPALADLVRDAQSGLSLSDAALRWHSGRRHASIDLEEIAHIRLDTRFDFSVRISVVLHSGRKIRLPYECTPPHLAFETALEARGIKVVRHHFEIFNRSP